MWSIESTTRLLKEMSQSNKPGELVRLFFDDVRRGTDIRGALVLSRVGLSAPQYRLVQNVNCDDESKGSDVFLTELREGGLLARLLYLGEFQNITNLSVAATDPAFDLLHGNGSLMAFPLFEKGTSTGLVVLLGSSPQQHNSADLAALATMTSLLGRAIETQKLASQLEMARGALDAELKAAAEVQRWLLPSLPALDDIGIAASYRTARYSGGDYYDVGRLPDGRIGLLIADVSGKGAAAAVLMAVLRSIVHDEVDRSGLTGPAALLDYLDTRLRALRLSERSAFVTAFCGVFDPGSGQLIYSSAGHNAPRLLRAEDRTITSLDGARTFPLGIVDEVNTHTEETTLLMPGDLAFFYTDGITEARSRDGEFFGVDRVDRILCALSNPITPDAAVQAVAKSVGDFAGDETPADDQTLVALSEWH